LDVLKLNSFKGFFLFNEEDLELMKANFQNTLDVFKSNDFTERDKGEVLEQIKKSESEINIGFFL